MASICAHNKKKEGKGVRGFLSFLYLMKIVSWNIRGLNHPLKQNEVKKFLCKYDVDVCSILKCKLDDAGGGMYV